MVLTLADLCEINFTWNICWWWFWHDHAVEGSASDLFYQPDLWDRVKEESHGNSRRCVAECIPCDEYLEGYGLKICGRSRHDLDLI